jgi:prophage regulatory protein
LTLRDGVVLQKPPRYAAATIGVQLAILSRLFRYGKGHFMRTILRKRSVLHRVGYSATQIWRLEKAGLFPRRIQLTEGGAVGWYEDEIDAWVNGRIRAVGNRPSCRGSAG